MLAHSCDPWESPGSKAACRCFLHDDTNSLSCTVNLKSLNPLPTDVASFLGVFKSLKKERYSSGVGGGGFENKIKSESFVYPE